MALTIPDFTGSAATSCYVTLAAGPLDASILLQLTDEQIATWTDDDLATRLTDLREALAALLPEGTQTQAIVSWTQSASVTTIDEVDPA